MIKSTLMLAASLLALALSLNATAVDQTIVSDNTRAWSVSETREDSMGQVITTYFMGKPQYVCLNASTVPPVPSSCPTMMMPAPVSYGYAYLGWQADLSSLPPNAKWIWASEKADGTPITGATTGAASAEFNFERKFYICGNHPHDGTIWVASDNTVIVFFNGRPVQIGSVGDSAVTTINIPAASVEISPNANVIVVKGLNYPNLSDCPSDKYQCNPAGVVIGAKFGDELIANPTCTNPSGSVGDIRKLGACPSPQTGSKESACVCLGGAAGWFDYDNCAIPPPACTDSVLSAWSACLDGQQTRTVIENIPPGCTGTPPTPPTLSRACTSVPPTCSAFTYSAWGQCQPDSTQSRTVLSSSPEGCIGGAPVTQQSCSYVPPVVAKGAMCATGNGSQVIGTCPAGTACVHRISSPGHKPPAWCNVCSFFTFGACGLLGVCQATPPLWTSDWFCDE